MSAARWVLWSRHKGTDQTPKLRMKGTLVKCRTEARFLTEASERNHGRMPYPYLDVLILPMGENPTARFNEIDPFGVPS